MSWQNWPWLVYQRRTRIADAAFQIWSWQIALLETYRLLADCAARKQFFYVTPYIVTASLSGINARTVRVPSRPAFGCCLFIPVHYHFQWFVSGIQQTLWICQKKNKSNPCFVWSWFPAESPRIFKIFCVSSVKWFSVKCNCVCFYEFCEWYEINNYLFLSHCLRCSDFRQLFVFIF